LGVLVLLAAIARQWIEIGDLQRLIYGHRAELNAWELKSAADESELVNLRWEVNRLRGQPGGPESPITISPGPAITTPRARNGDAARVVTTPAAEATPGAVSTPAAVATLTAPPPTSGGSAVDLVRWSARPGNQVVIEGTSSIHDWTVKGAIIGGYLEVEPAFLSEWPVPRSWTNQVRAVAQVKIPVRSLKSQVLVGASQMDKVMQEALRMKEHPDILYALDLGKARAQVARGREAVPLGQQVPGARGQQVRLLDRRTPGDRAQLPQRCRAGPEPEIPRAADPNHEVHASA
jgi:hypothetical protein